MPSGGQLAQSLKWLLFITIGYLLIIIRHSLSVCVTFSCWDDQCFSFQHKVFLTLLLSCLSCPQLIGSEKMTAPFRNGPFGTSERQWWDQVGRDLRKVGYSYPVLMSWKGRRYKQLEAVCWRVKVNKLIPSIIPMGHTI